MCGNSKCIYYDYDGEEHEMASGIDLRVEKIINDAKDILQKHQKMAKINTVYNEDRTIKDRDLTCLCGYKGNDGWVNHILGELMNVGLRPMTDEDVADILMNRIR